MRSSCSLGRGPEEPQICGYTKTGLRGGSSRQLFILGSHQSLLGAPAQLGWWLASRLRARFHLCIFATSHLRAGNVLTSASHTLIQNRGLLDFPLHVSDRPGSSSEKLQRPLFGIDHSFGLTTPLEAPIKPHSSAQQAPNCCTSVNDRCQLAFTEPLVP